ncbi:hypothetical protein D3C71_1952250 [compost metagenome]
MPAQMNQQGTDAVLRTPSPLLGTGNLLRVRINKPQRGKQLPFDPQLVCYGSMGECMENTLQAGLKRIGHQQLLSVEGGKPDVL